MSKENQQTMMLVKSSWQESQTFRMIPTSESCPYVECIYDTQSKVLAIIGNTKKNIFHMLPKLDDNGDVVQRKTRTEAAKSHKEERRSVETFQEYYLTDKEDIVNFIDLFCINKSAANLFLES